MEKDGRHHIGWCLDGKNYESWKFGMKLALQSDKLWGKVNGTKPKPDVLSKTCLLKLHLSLYGINVSVTSTTKLLRMATLGSVFGLTLFNDKLHPSTNCRGCLLGKMTRNSFLSTRTRGTHVGDIVHSDVCGHIHVCTPSGARFFVTFKDDFSSFWEINLLKRKSEVPEVFVQCQDGD